MVLLQLLPGHNNWKLLMEVNIPIHFLKKASSKLYREGMHTVLYLGVFLIKIFKRLLAHADSLLDSSVSVIMLIRSLYLAGDITLQIKQVVLHMLQYNR